MSDKRILDFDILSWLNVLVGGMSIFRGEEAMREAALAYLQRQLKEEARFMLQIVGRIPAEEYTEEGKRLMKACWELVKEEAEAERTYLAERDKREAEEME